MEKLRGARALTLPISHPCPQWIRGKGKVTPPQKKKKKTFQHSFNLCFFGIFSFSVQEANYFLEVSNTNLNMDALFVVFIQVRDT